MIRERCSMAEGHMLTFRLCIISKKSRKKALLNKLALLWVQASDANVHRCLDLYKERLK